MSSEQNHGERIGRLETSQEQFQKVVEDQFIEIRRTLNAIQNSLSRSKETNWFLVIAIMGMAVTLIGALWASAIRPINQDIERSQRDAATLAAAVVTKGELIADHSATLVKLASQLEVLQSQFQDVYAKGSPITDKRLTLLEHQMKHDCAETAKRQKGGWMWKN